MRQRPRTLLQLTILATLIEEPMNAYQVYMAIAEATTFRFPGYSAVHRALNGLHDNGYIVPISNSHYLRYQLTPDGRHLLASERRWLTKLQQRLTTL